MTEPLENDTPLCAVNAEDLERVWHLIRKSATVKADPLPVDSETVGIAAELILEHCGPNANVNAVFFRAALLDYLLQSGWLDNWRDGEAPLNIVFQVGAIFPIEQGVQGFDPMSFVERLPHQRL